MGVECIWNCLHFATENYLNCEHLFQDFRNGQSIIILLLLSSLSAINITDDNTRIECVYSNTSKHMIWADIPFTYLKLIKLSLNCPGWMLSSRHLSLNLSIILSGQ